MPEAISVDDLYKLGWIEEPAISPVTPVSSMSRNKNVGWPKGINKFLPVASLKDGKKKYTMPIAKTRAQKLISMDTLMN